MLLFQFVQSPPSAPTNVLTNSEIKDILEKLEYSKEIPVLPTNKKIIGDITYKACIMPEKNYQVSEESSNAPSGKPNHIEFIIDSKGTPIKTTAFRGFPPYFPLTKNRTGEAYERDKLSQDDMKKLSEILRELSKK